MALGALCLKVKAKQDTSLFAEGTQNVITGGSSTAKSGPNLSLTGVAGVEPRSQVITKYQQQSWS